MWMFIATTPYTNSMSESNGFTYHAFNQGNSGMTTIRPCLRCTLNSATTASVHNIYGEVYCYATSKVTVSATSDQATWAGYLYFATTNFTQGSPAISRTNTFNYSAYNGLHTTPLGLIGLEYNYTWGSAQQIYIRIRCETSAHNWSSGVWAQIAYVDRIFPTVVWYHNGSAWTAAIPQSHNGTKWREATCYSHDGSKWCMTHA